MASLATYAKLKLKQQFRPEEDAIFQLQFSKDLLAKYGTLVIDGYVVKVGTEGEVYNGTKITHSLNWSVGGQPYQEYTVAGGTLGLSPSSGQVAYVDGKMQARVEIGDELDGEGHVINPVFVSNVVLSDMLTCWDADFYFSIPGTMTQIGSYSTASSSCTVAISYNVRHDLGINGDNSVQGYRFYLYDSQHKLIADSEELYDWDSNVYAGHSYTFFDLTDNTTYYVRARLSLNGGYVMYRGTPSDSDAYIPIYVNYADEPTPSPNFTLTEKPAGTECTVDLTNTAHTKVVFSRSKYDESDYLEIGSVTSTSDTVSVMDKYAIPKTRYIYRAVVYNGSNVVRTYYNNIVYTSSCVKISDIYGCYTAIGDITKHPISRNDRGTILEAMDSVFPRNIINGSPNYDSGTVDGLFTDVDEDCKVITDSDYLAAKADALRAWLNNGHAKLLTYYTGEAWIVAVSGIQTTDPENNDVYHTTFNWTQIGNANRLSEYVRLGLVINNE